MADIEKISVGGTSYDVRDALAAHALSDIAVAGDNITFASTYTYNVQQQGSPTLADGTATGFSSTKYLYETNLPDDDVTYYFKVKMPSSLTWADIIRYGGENQPLLFLFAIWVEAGVNSLRVWNETAGQSEVIIPQISANMTYWLKVQISGDEKTYSYSTDGTNYTQSLVVNDPQTVSKYLQLGGGEHSGFNNGTVYLTECYAISNGVEVWRGATLDKTSINATGSSITVDQTYNSASANAQSGVAINGAGFLTKNVDRVAIGQSSSAVSQSVAIGYEATASGTNGVAIGGYGASASKNCMAIGGYVSANTNKYNALAIGFGANESSKTQATGYCSIAIGYVCKSTASSTIAIGDTARAQNDKAIAIGKSAFAQNVYAIQLGTGTNGDANTFSVGLSSSLNVRLLNSDGTIPGERMALQGTEAPTTATAGSVGQFYVDTTNQIGYMCVSAANSTYVWKQITA